MAISAAALCFAACAKEEVSEVAKTTLFATIDEGAKASLTSNGSGSWKTVWDEGDKISFGGVTFTIDNESIETGTARFTCEDPMPADGTYDVTYYPDGFEYTGQTAYSTVEGLKLPMLSSVTVSEGKIVDNHISFSAAVSVLQLTVTNSKKGQGNAVTVQTITTTDGNVTYKASLASPVSVISGTPAILTIALPAGKTYSGFKLYSGTATTTAVYTSNTNFTIAEAGKIYNGTKQVK